MEIGMEIQIKAEWCKGGIGAGQRKGVDAVSGKVH